MLPVRHAALVFALSWITPYTLHAQTEAATLRGVVHDASQAIVPGAGVILTNIDQNRSWKAISNERGEYDIEQIPPGHYSLSVESQGFKKYVQPNLTLTVNQVAELDVTLQTGSVNEVIEVHSEAPLLESASSALGEVVNHLSTTILPLNGRNVMQLVALTSRRVIQHVQQRELPEPGGEQHRIRSAAIRNDHGDVRSAHHSGGDEADLLNHTRGSGRGSC
jgi:hypothetical protein